MPLASQTARTPSLGRVSGGARWSRRRRRARRISRVGLVALGLTGLVAVYLWAPWRSPQGDASPAVAAADTETRTGETNPPADTRGVGLAATNALANPDRNVPTLQMGSSRQQSPTPRAQPASTSASSRTETERTLTGVPTVQDEPAARTTDALLSTSRFNSPDAVRTLIARAAGEADRGRPAEARLLYNRALVDPRTTAHDRELIRERMSALSELLSFSPTVIDTDPLAERYVIRSGDTLSKIAAQQGLNIDWRFLQRVNRISDPRRIREGQTIKLVRGPYHAVITKSAYRLDLYADLPTSAGGGRVFIASYRVGLGEYNSTPVGSWVVRKNSKLINPPWTNPRTGEYFSADNPLNPIGERWIGVEGTDDQTRTINGIGIHGTIEPQSIGQDASMGCVRMLDNDVEVIYELLTEGVSTVEILP